MFAEQFQERSTVHWLKQDVDDKMDIRCPLYQANLFGSKHHPHHHPWSGGEGGGVMLRGYLGAHACHRMAYCIYLVTLFNYVFLAWLQNRELISPLAPTQGAFESFHLFQALLISNEAGVLTVWLLILPWLIAAFILTWKRILFENLVE